jgi:ketosteroid isomerase-like protein
VTASENVEIIRRMFGAWHRGDRVAALAMIDPEIEIEARHESLHTGTYRGHAGMYELLEDFWAQFDDPHTEVKESIPSGDDVVVSLLHHGRGKSTGIEVEMWHWQVWTVRDGKAVRWCLFKTRQEALEAAGLGD